MANFTLKNDEFLDTNLLYKYRENFKTFAYSVTDRRFVPAVLKNLQFERPLYGRLDSRGNSIFLSEVFLRELAPRAGNLILVQDFVKDAFGEMSNYFARGLATNRLKTTGPYGALIPRKGFSSFHGIYANYLKAYNDNFLEYLRDSKIKKKVVNFEAFVDEFIAYMKLSLDNQVFTRSKYVESTYCDPFMTGLSISIANDEFNNDFKKYDTYYLDNNFNFFLESCRRFGFIVDKDAPWTIHFDLNSDASKRFLQSRDLQDINDVLDKRYYKAYFTDIVVIKDFLRYSYNNLFADSRIEFVDGVTKCQNPIISIVQREELSDNFINTKYTDLFWLKIYLKIKMVEEDFVLIKGEFDRIFSDVQQILRYGIPDVAEPDTAENRFFEAVDYINDVVLKYKKQIDYKAAKQY